MEDTYSPAEQFVIRILAHGEMRRKEITSLVGASVRWSPQTIGQTAADLAHDDDCEIVDSKGDNKNKLYFRTDIKSLYRRPKPEALNRKVEPLIRNLEMQFGIEDRSEYGVTDSPDPVSDVLVDFISLAHTHKNLLSEDDFQDRFFRVFDTVLDYLRDAYSGKESEKYGTVPEETFILFFLCVQLLHQNYCEGHENKSFEVTLRDRLPQLGDSLKYVPSSFGVHIHTLLISVDFAKEKKTYLENMIRSEEYDRDTLLTLTHHSYRVNNNLDELIEDLSSLQLEMDSKYESKILSLRNEVRALYTE